MKKKRTRVVVTEDMYAAGVQQIRLWFRDEDDDSLRDRVWEIYYAMERVRRKADPPPRQITVRVVSAMRA